MASHPTSELPVTSPDAKMAKLSRGQTQRKHTFFLKHTAPEVGGSHWAPSWLMGVLRFLAAGGCIVFGILFCLNPASNLGTRLAYVYSSAFIAMGLSFLLLSVCSFIDVFGKRVYTLL